MNPGRLFKEFFSLKGKESQSDPIEEDYIQKETVKTDIPSEEDNQERSTEHNHESIGNSLNQNIEDSVNLSEELSRPEPETRNESENTTQETSKEKQVDQNEKSTTDIKVESEKIETDSLQVANTIINQLTRDENEFGSARFNVNNLNTISDELLDSVKQTFAYPEELITEYYQILKKYRILLLTGPAESGKYFAAKYFAAQLKIEGESIERVCVVNPLPEQIAIDLIYLSNNSEAFCNTVVIFKDIFSKGNSYILDYFETFSSDITNEIVNNLKKKNTHLIFTLDSDTMQSSQFFLRTHDFNRTMEIPDAEMLKNALQRKIQDFWVTLGQSIFLISKETLSKLTSEPVSSELIKSMSKYEGKVTFGEERFINLLSKTIDEQQILNLRNTILKYTKITHWEEIYNYLFSEMPELAENLGTMRNVAAFIDLYLSEDEDKPKSIQELVDQVGDIDKLISYWFQMEMSRNISTFENLESWSFSICLAFFNGIPWVSFERVYRDITELIYKDFNPLRTKEQFSYSISEHHILTKCRAQIVKDVVSGVDIVEFTEPRYAISLSKLILTSHRRIVSKIREYLEKSAMEGDQYYRMIAARALGIIGENDPIEITFGYIDRWSKEKELSHRATVGYLFDGILRCNNKDYIQKALSALRRLAFSKKVERQWTAIAAYKQIGMTDLELAMKELRSITEKEILERHESIEKIGELLQHNYYSLEKAIGSFNAVFYKTEYLISTIRYSVIALCIMLDPIKVLAELRKWIFDGGDICEILVVLFFLGPNGISEVLENRAASQRLGSSYGGGHDVQEANIIISSMSINDESITVMINFLMDLYYSFNRFPTDIQRFLKIKLLTHLKNWTKEGLNSDKMKSTIEKLIVGLHKTGSEDFKDYVWNGVTAWESMNESSSFNKYVNKITDRILHS